MLANISPQNILNLLLLKPALDDQPPAPIHASTCPQFCEYELHDVLLTPLHSLADIRNVGKDSLLIPFAETLWWWNDVAFRATR